MDERRVRLSAPLPPGYVFVPKGNVYITKHCRAKTHDSGREMFVVVDKRDKVIGLRCPREVWEGVIAEHELTADKRADAVQRKDAAVEKEFEEKLLGLFPNVPRELVGEITKHAVQKHSRRVGRTGTKSLEQRVVLAVRAHVRHVHTGYERLLKEGVGKREAREQINDRVDEVVGGWAGETLKDKGGRKKKTKEGGKERRGQGKELENTLENKQRSEEGRKRRRAARRLAKRAAREEKMREERREQQQQQQEQQQQGTEERRDNKRTRRDERMRKRDEVLRRNSVIIIDGTDEEGGDMVEEQTRSQKSRERELEDIAARERGIGDEPQWIVDTGKRKMLDPTEETQAAKRQKKDHEDVDFFVERIREGLQSLTTLNRKERRRIARERDRNRGEVHGDGLPSRTKSKNRRRKERKASLKKRRQEPIGDIVQGDGPAAAAGRRTGTRRSAAATGQPPNSGPVGKDLDWLEEMDKLLEGGDGEWSDWDD